MRGEALQRLGITRELLNGRGLLAYDEATDLQVAEIDQDGREYLLTPASTAAWHSMCLAAQQDGIRLQIVSAYRSVQRQVEIIQGKLNEGLAISDILTVCAPPGYSEHHTGRAIDIDSGEDTAALEVEFETTPAFAWLQRRAHEFGFTMSYPRDNSLGYQYEPWHWCFFEG